MIETKDKEHLDKYVYIDYNGEFNLIDKTEVKIFSIFENPLLYHTFYKEHATNRKIISICGIYPITSIFTS